MGVYFTKSSIASHLPIAFPSAKYPKEHCGITETKLCLQVVSFWCERKVNTKLSLR